MWQSKAEAGEICIRMQLDMEFGTYIPPKPKWFSEYAEEIYFPKYKGEWSSTTRQHYMQLYQTEGGLKEKLENKYLSEITTEILQDMLNCYKDEGKAFLLFRLHDTGDFMLKKHNG